MVDDDAPERSSILGRPKDLSKRQAIIAAARSLFFSKGVEDVGMEQIAAAAEVSKMTVYGHFGDKASILGAVVEAETRHMVSVLAQTVGDERDLTQRLIDFGVMLLTLMTSPELIAFDRLVTAQAGRHPELALAVVTAGPRFGSQKIAEQLKIGVATGQLSIADIDKAAEQLTALWFGMPYIECRMEIRPTLTHEEISRHVEDGIELIMRAYAPAIR
jgi:TetR/AcrR family transcriptional repressor of mexJK operon